MPNDLNTTMPVFSISATTGISGALDLNLTFLSIKGYAGLNVDVETPFFSISATGKNIVSNLADATILSQFFSLSGYAGYRDGAVFEGIGPLAKISASGYIVPIGNLDVNMMLLVLNASISQSKDFIYDPLWYVKEGRIGYVSQDSPFVTINGAAS